MSAGFGGAGHFGSVQGNGGEDGGGGAALSFASVNGAAPSLASQPAADLQEGSLAYVATLRSYFQLIKDTLPATPTTVVAASGKAGYQWQRLVVNVPHWQAQTTWVIDPANSTGLANDENSGLSAAAPLLTYNEHALRWTNAFIRANAAVSVLGNQQATDKPIYSYWVAIDATVTFTGTPAVLFSSTVTSFTPLTFGTPAIDDAQLVDNAVPSGSFTAAGALAKGIILKRTNGTAIYAYVLKDLGTKTARLSQPCDPLNPTTQPAFAPGDSYQALRLAQITWMRFVDGFCFNTTIDTFDWHVLSEELPPQTNNVYFSTLKQQSNRKATFHQNPCFDTGSRTFSGNTSLSVLCGAFKGTGTSGQSVFGYFTTEGNVTCFQGVRVTSTSGWWNATQANFYDCTAECARLDTGGRIHFLGVINGKGNAGKVVKADQAGQIVWTPNQLFLNGITSDANPYQAGLTVSPNPIPLQSDFNGCFQIGATVTPSIVLKLSGGLLGGAGATTSYMADTGAAPAANLTAIEYSISQRIFTRLRVKPEANTFATNVVATVYKNGAPTAMTVTIPAGSTGVVADTAHSIPFADGDLLAVVLSNAGDAAKAISCMATLEGQ